MTQPPVIAFDIETVPDVAALRALHDLPAEVSDEETVAIAQRLQRQKKNTDFLPLHLHRVAVISCVIRRFDASAAPLKIVSLPHDDITSEAEAIDLFYRLIDKYQPALASWNGGGFDLPVLQYRAMMRRQRADTYHRNDGVFKWDNYTNRFHERHTDLMDVLSLYQARAYASLNDFAVLCGLPGKIGIGGGAVWAHWQRQAYTDIRRYCEHDALLTYLLYARWQHFRGRADAAAEEAFIRRQLQEEGARWQEFLSQWPAGDASDAPAAAPPPVGGALL